MFIKIELDKSKYQLNNELVKIIESEPKALAYFNSLTGSHQKYFSKWIESAKTMDTRHVRIVCTLNAMLKKQGYAEMIREKKTEMYK